jgi:recombination protein RecT
MAVTNSLVSNTNKKPAFSAVISSDGYKKMINNTLRDPKRANRFVANVTSAVSANPALQECDAATIVSSALLGESLELSPSPVLAHFYMVPFKDNKRQRTVAQFQLGYKGYIQLAIRSGQYRDIDAIEIRDGECKGRDKLSGKYIFEFIEDEDIRENTPIIGYLAYFELLNGFKKQMYFPIEKMLNHADKYSKAFSRQKYEDLHAGKIPQSEAWKYSSPWYTGFDGMALKTVLRQLLSKYGLLSIELRTALDNDMAAINADGSVDYVDNSGDYSPAPAASIPVDPDTGEVLEGEIISDADGDAVDSFFGEE